MAFLARMAVAVLLLASACAHGPNARAKAGSPVVQFDMVTYDGESLRGRLLLSVREGPITVDSRVIEYVSANIRDVRDCSTNERVRYTVQDYFPASPKTEELLLLEPGYWYGRNLDFLLFPKAPGPACIQALLTYHLEGSASGESGDARLTVRAEKEVREEEKSSPPSEGP